MRRHLFLPCLFIGLVSHLSVAQVTLNEAPVRSGEWGYRPIDGQPVAATPPSFVWRPTARVVRWELVVQDAVQQDFYRVDDWTFNAHTPPKVFPPGKYSWRYRGFDNEGTATNWSQTRTFEIPDTARPMPLPERTELLSRIPSQHPRIFVRPEGIERLRQLAQNELNAEYRELVRRCENLLRNPPDTTEPPLYIAGSFNAAERDTWWGNRERTIRVLENAALLAFVWNLDGNEKYAELAKKLLMDASQWDPLGATGFRYNDEAGMPYNYNFARTYTFLNSLLTEEEKERCRAVMKVRGDEMARNLFPRMFWTPYDSHANRAWHKLGEIGLAFYGEISEAADWVWYAMNNFYATYPVWSDDDGGWHEGLLYWQSYQIRFCWWADAMQAAFGISAFDKPYYSQIGFYPLYYTPPGRNGTIFGDRWTTATSRMWLELIDIVAMQSGDPHWRWYVDAHPNFQPPVNYYTFIRKAAALDRKPDPAKPPTDLPTARWFRGTGQVVMNTNLLDAAENVQLLFKSAPAPFGAHSHGYEAQNSFIFSAWNEDLLINTGWYDLYGSPHHAGWVWSTRSVNNITVDGIGQLPRSNQAIGEIVQFEHHSDYDIVVGDAPMAYRATDNPDYPDGKVLEQYRRSIVFIKPDLLIVYDRLKAVRPATFEYWLHAKNPVQPLETWFPDGKSLANNTVFADWLKTTFESAPINTPEAVGQIETFTELRNLGIRVDKVAARLDVLIPEKLEITQTNQYDPNPDPQPRFAGREWHVTAKTPEKKPDAEFLLVVRPWKVAETETVPQTDVTWERDGNELAVKAVVDGKMRTVLFGREKVIVLP
ncbi:MAG: DUF4962 domain-containing protein [Planctomycetaceae bacterium]|nr:DUF4962 domain-containing protein [Planctomycetaceae bacterium]